MAYRGLKSDLDILQSEYTPFAGQNHTDEEEDSDNEAPPQRFAGGGVVGGFPRDGRLGGGEARRGSGLQATCCCLRRLNVVSCLRRFTVVMLDLFGYLFVSSLN